MSQGVGSHRYMVMAGIAGAFALAINFTSPTRGEPIPLVSARSAGANAPSAREPAESAASGTFVDRISAKGQRARGLYFTYPYVDIFKARGVARLVSHARLDAAVIDLKDDQGRISYRTQVAALAPQVVSAPLDLKAVVQEIHAAGHYAIARIVCFNDPQLPKREPDRAILDARPKYAGKNKPWVSWGTGNTWLNPYNKRNHDLYIEMAKEAEAMGFDEVQLDYIRFPVDKGVEYAQYEPSSEELRRFVLLDMLRRVDAAIKIPLGVDVFGLAAIRRGDPTGLGQSLTDWTAHVEVFSPMLYVNAMPGWRMDVEDRGHVLVKGPSYILRQRVGPGPVIRPFMQAFHNGLGDKWNPDFIAQEITGARLGDADGFLFWNPGSNYTMVQRGVAQLAGAIMPFPSAGRDKFREELWARGEHELSPPDQRNDKYGW
jgi:hypothetical protein